MNVHLGKKDRGEQTPILPMRLKALL